MKYFLILVLCINSIAYSMELKLGVEPIINPSLMKKELVPLLAFANEHIPTRYVASYSFAEVVRQIQSGEINTIYASSSYFYLLKKLGFVPVLKSRQTLHQVMIHNPDKSHQAFNRLYYVKNDLSSMFRMRGLDLSKIKPVPTMTSEVAIFAVLKDAQTQALIMEDELGLLSDVMKNKIMVTDRRPIGVVYLMAHQSIAQPLGDWWIELGRFHQTFKDPDGKYNYLNIYQFDRFNGEDAFWEGRLDEYNTFIQPLLEEVQTVTP